MSANTEPRSGLFYGWSLGESGWNVGMDANLTSIGRYAYHLSVKDRDLATPPGSPASGDTYIVAASGTGAWSGKDKQVAVWDNITSAWVFGVPRLGWKAYVEDEKAEVIYDGTVWTLAVNRLTYQGNPTGVNVTATLLIADLRSGIITSTTAAAVAATLPTGTLMDGGFAGPATDMAFDWTVINTGSNGFTVGAGTGHTVVGNMMVAAGTSGRFRSRRTAATTWVTYRLA